MSMFKFAVTDMGGDRWAVTLPHRSAASGRAANAEYADYSQWAEAVVRMRQFVAEAQQALAALEERRELGSRWDA